MVKEGYKQTEIGVIPEDWEYAQFQDVLEGFTSGMTPYRGHPEYYTGNIKWITSGELNYNIITDTQEKITPEAVEKTNLKILPKGTFLMAITGLEAEGTRGSCGIIGEEATTNQSCMALFSTDKLITEYLFYYYVKYGSLFAFKYCQGTKQQSYTAKIVKILPIVYPPNIKEQKAIAKALSDTDSLISSLQELITKKEHIKTATMQQLLTGKKRLDGFSGEWVEKKLGEIANITIGNTPSRANKDYWGNGYKWVSIGDLKLKYIDNTKEQITKKASYIAQIIPKGTLIMSFKLSIGKLAFITEDMYSNEAICALRNLKADKDYLYYILQTVDFSLYGKQAVKGYTLNQDSLSSVIISYPALEEQKAIAKILSDMDNEIEVLKDKLEKVKAIKNGMMQELLSGRVRLKGEKK